MPIYYSADSLTLMSALTSAVLVEFKNCFNSGSSFDSSYQSFRALSTYSSRPRTGLPPELCGRLQSAQASRLVLVGCDGAAFCRDIKRLAPAWRLESLAAVDLFPYTHHAECVALLEPVRP